MSERRNGATVPVLVAGVFGAEVGDRVAGLGLGGELAEPGGEGRVGVGPDPRPGRHRRARGQGHCLGLVLQAGGRAEVAPAGCGVARAGGRSAVLTAQARPASCSVIAASGSKISKSLVLRALCRGRAGLDAQVAEQGGHVGRPEVFVVLVMGVSLAGTWSCRRILTPARIGAMTWSRRVSSADMVQVAGPGR